MKWHLALVGILVLLCALLPQDIASETFLVGKLHIGYGVNIADLKNTPRIKEMGFDWMKSFIAWSRIQPDSSAAYDWTDLDKAISAAQSNGLHVLLRIDRAPQWTHPINRNQSAPPDAAFLPQWADFVGTLASRAKRRVAAYEIWNEPNINSEWGGKSPDPIYYVEMLKVACQRIKSADPKAIVVSAGLAPTTGDGGITAMNDLEYLKEMYRHGAAHYFDVLGSHPYGLADPPDSDPNVVASFRQAEKHRRLMVEYGDGHKQIWATEFGWMLDPVIDGNSQCRQKWGGEVGSSWLLSEETQARYLVDTYQYAYENWQWMGVMFLFNLDFSLAPWYRDPCQPMRYFSILNDDGSERAAFSALKRMR